MRYPEINMDNGMSSESKKEELDVLVSNIKEKLTVKCRPFQEGRCRSSPYCVPITANTRALDIRNNKKDSFLPNFTKCNRCFSRNCVCNKYNCLRDQDDDSIALLKKLLNDQTLIQEAVKRLHCPKPKENRPPRTRHNSENVCSEEYVHHSYESAEESDYDM